MSYVTNVIVSVGILDHETFNDYTRTPFANDDRFRLGSISDYSTSDNWGGSKFPECTLYAGAFNYVPLGEFMDWLRACPFDYPDEVQLFVKDQNDDRWQIHHLTPVREWTPGL